MDKNKCSPLGFAGKSIQIKHFPFLIEKALNPALEFVDVMKIMS
jgi:hypothetical protein